VAVDTRSKRASSAGVLLPFILTPPAPDGTIDQGDRQHGAWMYSGILAAAAAAGLDLDVFYTDYVELVAGYGDSAERDVGYTDYVELVVRVKT
jgi:hypothetical protein